MRGFRFGRKGSSIVFRSLPKKTLQCRLEDVSLTMPRVELNLHVPSLESARHSAGTISSREHLSALFAGSPYAASKAAMNQVTRMWGCEWAPDGIRVNAVAPWYTKTPLTESVQADPVRYAKRVSDFSPPRSLRAW